MRSVSRSRDMCEWGDFDLGAPRIRALLAQGESRALPPFLLLSAQGVTAREQLNSAELWTRDRLALSAPIREKLDFRFDLGAKEKIRVGYLSNDFNDHAAALLLIETFEEHDRARFEVHAFSFGADDGKAMRPRIRAAMCVFHDISALSDIEAAQAIHLAGIDILIDLKGFTQGARTGVLMLRPAPIQVNFLGFPGTLGAGVCDYIVTDRFMTPPETSPDYSESFAYMPHSYLPHGRAGALGAAPTRAEVNLPENGFVFCCFNQAFKITPSIFGLWRRLLEATPGSVLWLLSNSQAEGNLRGEAINRGLRADRLVFAPDAGQADHLARLQLADLVLDTAPYGAHTTASDALWSGVPVVTFPAETFASRVAGSLLHAVGLPELIATSQEDYFDIALDISSDPKKLATVKAKLSAGRMNAPLFNVVAYTRALEGLFETMWSRRQKNVLEAIGAGIG
jgi:predicted O-linked N-acetylglucosamine transferase (SPINDLY family)